jgi:hypothetical protein
VQGVQVDFIKPSFLFHTSSVQVLCCSSFIQVMQNCNPITKFDLACGLACRIHVQVVTRWNPNRVKFVFLAVVNIVTCPLKVRIVEPEETAVSREQLCKHVSQPQTRTGADVKSESKSRYDRRLVGQSALASSPIWSSRPALCYCQRESCCYVDMGLQLFLLI